MEKQINLKDKEFLGKIVPKSHSDYYDPKRQGRYLVHIPDLMPLIEDTEGIYCKNHVHKWRITPSDIGEYGSYFPLHAGTYVMVRFFENDLNTGYIDRIISDYKEERDVEAQDCVSAIPAIEDRDEQYVLFKTPKKWNIFYVNEETENEPNTIYLIYNRDNSPERRTVFRIDESGLHFWTRDNKRVRIASDENRQVDGEQTEYIKKNQKQNIDKNRDTTIKGDRTSEIKGTYDSKVGKDVKEETGGNYDAKVSGGSKIETGGDYNAKVGGNSIEETSGNFLEKTGQNHVSETSQNRIHKTGQNEVRESGANWSQKVGANLIIEVTGAANISSVGPTSIFSAAAVNIDAPAVNINSGAAQQVPAPPATPPSPPAPPVAPSPPKPETEVIDLGPEETSEYQSGVGKKCDNATSDYNVGPRDNEEMI